MTNLKDKAIFSVQIAITSLHLGGSSTHTGRKSIVQNLVVINVTLKQILRLVLINTMRQSMGESVIFASFVFTTATT